MSAQHSQAQNHHHQYQHQRQQQLEASQRQGQPQPGELQPHPRTPLKDHSGAEQEPLFAFAGVSPVACAEEHQNVSSGYREQQQQPHAQHMKNEQWHPPRKAGELANRLLCEGMDAEDEHLIPWQQHRSNRGKRKRFAASKAHEPGSKAKRQYQQEQELMHSNAEQHRELFCAASVGKGFGESTSCTEGNASFALERTDPPSSWSAAHEQATTSTAAGAAGSSDATEVQAYLLEQPQRPVQIRKNVPWTTEEHRMFLLGLEQYGKGDWRNISKFFVKSRTPTQVAVRSSSFSPFMCIHFTKRVSCAYCSHTLRSSMLAYRTGRRGTRKEIQFMTWNYIMSSIDRKG
jgi:SHAQKYF class myb-like DNA-binding protein